MMQFCDGLKNLAITARDCVLIMRGGLKIDKTFVDDSKNYT